VKRPDSSSKARRTRTYAAPRGTLDILPEDEPYWRFVQAAAEETCRLFGYRRMETPMFEDVGLFSRTVGEATDIVEKEMYVFSDRGGQELALRPEWTANICRAYLQHGMHNRPQPVRVWYWGPTFRYQRPQAGRYRQFTQFGCEAIGEGDPSIDAECVEMAWDFYGRLGLRDLRIELSSIGDPTCRPAYQEALRSYYADKLDRLCADCQRRYDTNIMRLLDCKTDMDGPVTSRAPSILDHLCADCRDHFDALRSYLDEMGIPYTLNPRLARGLDYYTRTVFEITPPGEGSQSSLCGGGRYDGLIELLGSRPTPAIGFAAGLERTIATLRKQSTPVPPFPEPTAYVACQSSAAAAAALRLTSDLRKKGVSALAGVGGRSLKAQMRHANALGIRRVLILGEDELAKGTVTVRDMTTGEQKTVPRSKVAPLLTHRRP
jgi:histidyl-tRNA synthetase